MKYDLSKNIEEAERELVSRPVKATTAELLLIRHELRHKYRDKPQPIRYGLYLGEILENVSGPLEDYDLIAGRSIHRELNGEEEEKFQAYIKEGALQLARTMLDNGHAIYSWEDVVKLGLVGLKLRAEETLSKSNDEDKCNFLRGAILVYEAIESYLLRYSRKALELGMPELSEGCRATFIRRFS